MFISDNTNNNYVFLYFTCTLNYNSIYTRRVQKNKKRYFFYIHNYKLHNIYIFIVETFDTQTFFNLFGIN